MSGEYKPYTTPYTGAGAVKTDRGWVNCRDFGAPGTSSGPGKNYRSGAPVPAFHNLELTTTNVGPPGSEGKRHTSPTFGGVPPSGPVILPGSNTEIKEIEGPGGHGFDLPEYHEDLSSMSNIDIALKIGLLNIKKGNIYENLHQAATDREILSHEPLEQMKFRSENTRQLSEIEKAIRAWEGVQAARTANMPNPGLVDMLMIRQDRYGRGPYQTQKPTPDADEDSSPNPQSEGQEEEPRH